MQSLLSNIINIYNGFLYDEEYEIDQILMKDEILLRGQVSLKNEELLKLFTVDLINEFNEKYVDAYNMNTIISLCEKIKMDNIMDFIIDNAVPSMEPYILNEHHVLKYKLPRYMTCSIGLMCGDHHRLLLLNNNLCNNAAKCGYIEHLKWGVEHGYIIDDNTYRYALKSGHKECLEYIAAEYGDIKYLKYLHENGCEW